MSTGRYILCSFCLLTPVHTSLCATETLVPVDLGEQFQIEQQEYFQDQQVVETTQPSDTMRYAAFWGCAGATTAANLAVLFSRKSTPSLFSDILCTISWLGGAGFLSWAMFKITPRIRELEKLFDHLVDLSKQEPLERILRSYNRLTLDDKQVEKDFAKFASNAVAHTNQRNLQREAYAFISKQIKNVSRRLYTLRVLSNGVAGLLIAQLITGSFPCSWVGPGS